MFLGNLPHWEKDLDFRISDLFPYDVDRKPVSVNRMYGTNVEHLAEGALALESEFIYLCGLSVGSVGTMTWDGSPDNWEGISLGFTMMFGYSQAIEDAIVSFVASTSNNGVDDIMAGVTECFFWSNSMPREARKVIMIATTLPLKDEEAFISDLADDLYRHKSADRLIPYYAETFGLRRLAVPYETDDLLRERISLVLQSFELQETRQVVGPSPDLAMPPLFDVRF